MAVTIAAVKTALATRLATISGLHVHATMPGSVTTPAAIVQPGGGQFLAFDQAMGVGIDDLTLSVLVVVSAGDERIAQTQLDAYLAPTGTGSVKAAVDGDLGGTVDYATVTGAQNYGLHEIGGTPYWGAELLVSVAVS
jgi:hypothetical protein